MKRLILILSIISMIGYAFADTKAERIRIVDEDEYFVATEVESALAELYVLYESIEFTTLFELDVNDDVMPTNTALGTDPLFELDVNDDIQPKAA